MAVRSPDRRGEASASGILALLRACEADCFLAYALLASVEFYLLKLSKTSEFAKAKYLITHLVSCFVS